MPGGAKAVREPWRMAAVYLHRTLGDDFLNLDLPFRPTSSTGARGRTLRGMTATGTNSPETSSMGRLFDAVAGLLCLRSAVNYEGQAAIELEAMADRECERGLRVRVRRRWESSRPKASSGARSKTCSKGVAPGDSLREVSHRAWPP